MASEQGAASLIVAVRQWVVQPTQIPVGEAWSNARNRLARPDFQAAGDRASAERPASLRVGETGLSSQEHLPISGGRRHDSAAWRVWVVDRGGLVGWQAIVASAAGPVDELASKLPDQPNAVVALHVAKILDSPIGKAEGWREKYTSRFESGPLMVPPTPRISAAADLELSSMSPRWEAAVFNLSTSPTMDQIAKVVSGRRDTSRTVRHLLER